MATNVSPCTQRQLENKEKRENATLRVEPGRCIIPPPAPHVLEFLSLSCMLRGHMYVCTTQCAQFGMEATISKKKKRVAKVLHSYVHTAGKSSKQMCSMRIRNGKSSVRGGVWCVTTRTFFFSSQSQGATGKSQISMSKDRAGDQCPVGNESNFSWVQLLPFSLTL